MINRNAAKSIREGLRRQAAVAIIGPRQVGKTTLAWAIFEGLRGSTGCIRRDSPSAGPVHRASRSHRQGRRTGKGTGRFLILGSAAIDLSRQSSESLAGRIEYIELDPLNCLEIPEDADAHQSLWVRGGFPQSFLAQNGRDSLIFRRNFIRTFLERDVPQFGPRIAAETLERLWIMLARIALRRTLFCRELLSSSSMLKDDMRLGCDGIFNHLAMYSALGLGLPNSTGFERVRFATRLGYPTA